MNVFDEIKKLWHAKDESWVLTDKETFYQQLCMIPPVKQCSEGFMCGECWDSNEIGDIYAVFFRRAGRFYCKYSYFMDWNPANYLEEIKKQYDS